MQDMFASNLTSNMESLEQIDDDDIHSGISDESDHPELDEDFEMNADLADPETGYLLGKSNIANHLW
jgi:hypothetical protein